MKDFANVDKIAPTFDGQACESYFATILSEKHPSRSFTRPDWMPPTSPSPPPSHWPSFKEISKIVASMKAGSSPCPLDGMSIIAFEKCPILITHLTRLLCACWAKKHFPRIWRRARITLIHKKGYTSDMQNFRPIALQPVVGKIVNSFVRNKVWSFLTRNNLIDTSIQKGFWPGINGVTEHL